jgi:hypothetical protein
MLIEVTKVLSPLIATMQIESPIMFGEREGSGNNITYIIFFVALILTFSPNLFCGYREFGAGRRDMIRGNVQVQTNTRYGYKYPLNP